MLIRLLFWFILFYFTFQFVLKVVIPVLTATRAVRSKVKDVNEKRSSFQPDDTVSANENTAQSQTKTSSAKGDYIDFEEIK